MKAFVLKILLFSFLALILGIFCNYVLFTPMYDTPVWGNETLTKKVKMLKEGNYNLVTFGSSKIHCHVIPSVLDSCLEEENIKSFNMGVEGTFPPEAYWVFEKLLDEGYFDNDVDYLLLEVRAIQEEKYKNWHSLRSYYWNDYDKFIQHQKLMNDCSLSKPRKIFARMGSVVSLMNQWLNTGEGQYLIEAKYPLIKETVKDISMKKNAGFSPLKKTDYTNRDTSEYQKLREISLNAFSDDKNVKKANRKHLDILKSIQKKVETKGITIYFYMAESQKKWMYEELIPIFNELPEKNKIIISDANEYPILYNTEQKFNLTHFNEYGSIIFSKYLADSLRDKMKGKSSNKTLNKN